MQTRTMRARRIAAVGLLTALASFGAFADTPDTPRPETSLLGVRLQASFNDVLRKFGQPNEIQVGDPTVSGQGQTAANGGMSGGPMGMPGGAGRSGYPGGPMGMPGGAGRNGYPGGPMGMPGTSGGAGRNGYPGGPMGMSGGPGVPGVPGGRGLPGMSGGPMGMPGMSGGPMGMPGMSGGGNNGNNTEEDSGETTWWYHFPQQGLHYSFLFNKEGRVIQIQAYGQKPFPKIVVPRSAQGITLGADLGQVIRKYGWSNDGEHSGDYVVMRYDRVAANGQHDRIAFQSRHNRVLGIVLGVVNKSVENPGMAGATGGPGGYGAGNSGGGDR